MSSKNYSEVFTVLNKYEKEFMCEQICNLLNTRCIQSITQVNTEGVYNRGVKRIRGGGDFL